MNEKFNKNAKVEKFTNMLGDSCTPYRYRSFTVFVILKVGQKLYRAYVNC